MVKLTNILYLSLNFPQINLWRGVLYPALQLQSTPIDPAYPFFLNNVLSEAFFDKKMIFLCR